MSMFKKKINPLDVLTQIFDQADTINKQDVEKNIQLLRTYLATVVPSQELTDFIIKFFQMNFPLIFIKLLPQISFESRKDLCAVFGYFIHRTGSGDISKDNDKLPLTEYVTKTHPEVVKYLLDGLQGETALSYGQLLQSFAKITEIADFMLKLLHTEHFERLFTAMNSKEFEVSSEACVLFKELLTKHQELVSKFMNTNPDFLQMFLTLLSSPNYATRRFSLHQLGDLLLSKQNFETMHRFVKSDINLKLIMQLLKDQSQAIRLEAFHVFKIFVACPDKPEATKKILLKNKDKLIEFLEAFQVEGGQQAEDEKQFVIDELKRL
ncbi:Mo25_family protein [Hexamita inflata]|uniref:Mo25 family protein n=1 Tax=Hexamita inflata TaxID=28002 RepID=A0AA86V4T1_9EUKA|nr:Mo25 family protein [Hexamita inflata]CAI9919641.1 Mo25 family protein [Hexamita inflata]CAI9976377.1 Mo25 family protein [Hexamita inflata]